MGAFCQPCDPTDPRFRDLVAEVAAPLRGVPRDQLIGADRRLNWLRNAAAALLALLAVAAVWAATIAVEQRNDAQRALAANHVRDATAYLSSGDPSGALPSLASAVRLDPSNVAVRAAALGVLPNAQWPLVSVEHADRVTAAALAWTADGW